MNRLLVAVLASALSLVAADASGKWSGSLTPADSGEEQNPHPAHIIIKVDGNKLTGSGGPNETEQHPMQNGTVKGNRLVFDIVTGNGTLHFELTLKDDNELEGSVQMMRDSGTQGGKVSLKRLPA